MTIVAAMIDDATGTVVVGTDSHGSGWTKAGYGGKIVRLSESCALAYAGTYLLPTWILAENVEPPDPTPRGIAGWWASWRAWARGQGNGKVTDDGAMHVEGAALLCVPGGIHMLNMDGAVIQPEDGYAAMGSGESVALGALATARALRIPAERAVPLAVAAAILHASGCGGDVHVQAVWGQRLPRHDHKLPRTP